MSPQVLTEIREVLGRPSLKSKFPALESTAVDLFLAKCLRSAKWFSHVPDVYQVKRDPKDSKYVNLAIAAGSCCLVSTDRDLLELANTASPEGRDFRTRFPEIEIMEPVAFVSRFSPAHPP
jgi:putative PIN family toxin of toxin-antitoxin system